MSDPENIPFADYLNAVDDLLEQRFGITTNDCDLEQVAGAQEDLWTPEQFMDWIVKKYGLQEIETGWK